MDFSTLQKGDVITVVQIEIITGTTCSLTDVPTYQEFALARLNLKPKIEAEYRKTHDGRMPTLVQRGENLVILNDVDSAIEAKRNVGRSIRKVARTLRQGKGVNTKKLTIEQREEHLSNLGTAAWMTGECRRKRRADKRTLNKLFEARRAKQEKRAAARATQKPRKRYSAVKEAAVA